MKRRYRIFAILVAMLFTISFISNSAEAYISRSFSPTIRGSYGVTRSISGAFTGSPSLPAPPPSPTPAPPPAPLPAPLPGGATVTLNQHEQLLLTLVNAARARAGIPALVIDARLVHLARLKSQDMIDNRYFAHRSPVYGSFGDMLRSNGIRFSLAAENIGVGGNVTRIFNAFMNSGGHRNKILDARYSLTGIGIIYQRGRGYLVTQHFLRPR